MNEWTPPENAVCWEDNCKNPAIARKPHGMAYETPVNILVCYEHLNE